MTSIVNKETELEENLKIFNIYTTGLSNWQSFGDEEQNLIKSTFTSLMPFIVKDNFTKMVLSSKEKIAQINALPSFSFTISSRPYFPRLPSIMVMLFSIWSMFKDDKLSCLLQRLTLDSKPPPEPLSFMTDKSPIPFE